MLTAWLIQDQFPELGNGDSVNLALKQKKVDGVSITFNTDRFNNDRSLTFLLSNRFGKNAYMMLQTAPRRALLRVTRFA